MKTCGTCGTWSCILVQNLAKFLARFFTLCLFYKIYLNFLQITYNFSISYPSLKLISFIWITVVNLFFRSQIQFKKYFFNWNILNHI